MEVRVLREACCAQDDQLGPLEATYDVPAGAAFSALVALIQESRFLQYSASHIVLQGEVAGTLVVKVFSPFNASNKQAEFFANAGQTVASIIGTDPLLFRFVFE